MEDGDLPSSLAILKGFTPSEIRSQIISLSSREKCVYCFMGTVDSG